ncbi:MAG: AAA family ATPase [Hyphomicrobiaceae bacterium]
MKILSFICQKGGTGKTTLALNIAIEAMRSGMTVAVVDLDPQPSACAWSDLRRKREEPVVIDAKPARLATAVDTARAQDGLDLLIIDTGGRTEEGAFAAAKASDLVIVPVQPSAVDLKSIPATRDLIAMAGNPKALAVLTRSKPFGTRHAESEAWLKAAKIDVATTIIGDRITFQDAYAAGQGVSEFAPGSRAADETGALFAEIARLVGLTTSRQVNKQKSGVADNGKQTTKSRRAR